MRYFKTYLDKHKIQGFIRSSGPADGLSDNQIRALDELFSAFNISSVALTFKGTETALLVGLAEDS